MGLRFSVLMMTFQGMEYLPYSLQSIYDFADEIIICDGIIQQFNLQHNQDCKANGGSTDGTDEFIHNFNDKDNKIKFKVGQWRYEKEKRQYMLNQAKGDWMFVVDIDEVYKPEHLQWIKQKLKDEKRIKAVWLHHYRFCRDFNHYYLWGCNVFQKMYPHCRLYGLRDMLYDKRKVFKYPFHESKNVTRAEFDKHLIFPNEHDIVCYHYSNVCSKEKSMKKKAIAQGLGHNISQWESDWFGIGISKEEYFQRRNIKEFKGEHPEIMKSHPYYNSPPDWWKHETKKNKF